MTITSADCRDSDLDRQAWPGRSAQGRVGWPSWARWNRACERRFTIGVEEELMLLSPSDFSLAQSGEKVLRRLSGDLYTHAAPETHASVIELATGIHSDVAGAVAELAALRAQLDRELRAMGLIAASVGMYPLDYSGESRVSGSARYGVVADSMRMLARREPTLALHVHIGVPDPEDAVRVLNGLRDAVPVLLALSANSPFSRGHDSGFASARTVIFQAFPRTGTARRFSGYADYVQAVDALIASGALPDPSFLWWDVRLQPALGTVEVRVMDTQTTVADTAALIALVHSLARLELEGESVDSGSGPEVLAENRFLAARDGLDARLIDPEKRVLVPVRALLDALLARCSAHADPVGMVELDRVRRLASSNGAQLQRRWAREDGLVQLVSKVTQRFAAPSTRSQQRPPSAPACEREFR
jgi:glutamate---cysteine ligase / carboxylate-amine ligase